jgi:hypothetical protein
MNSRCNMVLSLRLYTQKTNIGHRFGQTRKMSRPRQGVAETMTKAKKPIVGLSTSRPVCHGYFMMTDFKPDSN